MSLVEEIRERLAGDPIAELRAAIDAPADKANAVIDAAIPAILSMMASAVLDAQWLDALLKALRVPSAEAGPTGATASPIPAALAEVLSRFTGLELSATRALLDRLAPVILAVVGSRLEGMGGATPGRVAELFSTEKGNITRALPSGLSLSDLPSMPGVPTAASALAATSSQPAWLVPLTAAVLLALAVVLAWTMPPERRPSPRANDPSIPPAPSGNAPTPVSAGEVTRELARIHDAAINVLGGVRDASSAEAVRPALRELGMELDVAKGLRDQLPPDAAGIVAREARKHLDDLKGRIAGMTIPPGSEASLKPLLDSLVARLAAIAD